LKELFKQFPRSELIWNCPRSSNDLTSDSCDSPDGDSSVEITSMLDECENELIRLSTYLQLETEDEDDDEQNFEWPDPPPSLLSSSSSDIEELNGFQQVMVSTTPTINVNTGDKSMKRKRRQWTVKEKLGIVRSFDKTQSKRETSKKEGCTASQLRNWIKNKENLLKMYKEKKGFFLFSFSLGMKVLSLLLFR
jgi:hypothetical protein